MTKTCNCCGAEKRLPDETFGYNCGVSHIYPYLKDNAPKARVEEVGHKLDEYGIELAENAAYKDAGGEAPDDEGDDDDAEDDLRDDGWIADYPIHEDSSSLDLSRGCD